VTQEPALGMIHLNLPYKWLCDENGLLIDDPDHSEQEDRFLLLGLSANFQLLVVSHTYSEADLTIRIISARKATRSEQGQYWKRW
jgi:uncharacterized protein